MALIGSTIYLICALHVNIYDSCMNVFLIKSILLQNTCLSVHLHKLIDLMGQTLYFQGMLRNCLT